MIDFGRALQTAFERMCIILFQPFDIGKWGLIGFNAFLALLAEGGVSVNNPLPSTNNDRTAQNYSSVPDALHAFKQFTTWMADLPNNPWLKLLVCFALAYLIIWLVLTWVGCRAQFVFLDNIVRNRAALAGPWQRYAPQGNAWYLFHLGLILLTFVGATVLVGAFLLLNWTWINAARDPAGGEIVLVVVSILVIFVLAVIGVAIQFLIRSLALPLYFKQTMSLGAALLAVVRLVVTRPLSIFVYLLVSLALWFIAAFIACFVMLAAFFATCSLICCVSCFPFVGAMLVLLVYSQLLLPITIFQRCFQLGVLEQFGPEYDVFSVDLPPVPARY